MLELKQSLYTEILEYAKSCYPNECCGYFLGKQNIDTQINQVKEIFKIKNIHQNPKHFFMLDPQDQLNALIKAKQNVLEIIGIFHSHPFSQAYPSEEDLKYIYDSRQSYCIISLQNEPKVASYRIDKSKISEEKIIF